MATILAVLHGPNLNLLGRPDIYGSTTLADIDLGPERLARDRGHHRCMQSNAEYELVERVQDAGREGVNFILINPAAFTPPAWHCGTPWPRSPSRLSRFTCQNIHARGRIPPFLLFLRRPGALFAARGTGLRTGLLAALQQLDQP